MGIDMARYSGSSIVHLMEGGWTFCGVRLGWQAEPTEDEATCTGCLVEKEQRSGLRVRQPAGVVTG